MENIIFYKDIIRYIVINFLDDPIDIARFLMSSKIFYSSFNETEKVYLKPQFVKKEKHLKCFVCLKKSYFMKIPRRQNCKRCPEISNVEKRSLCRQCNYYTYIIQSKPWLWKPVLFKCVKCLKIRLAKEDLIYTHNCCCKCDILCNDCIVVKECVSYDPNDVGRGILLGDLLLEEKILLNIIKLYYTSFYNLRKDMPLKDMFRVFEKEILFEKMLYSEKDCIPLEDLKKLEKIFRESQLSTLKKYFKIRDAVWELKKIYGTRK